MDRKRRSAMNENILAAVGDGASVSLFHTAGVTTKSVATPEEAEKAIINLIRDGKKIIFVTEVFLKELSELTEKYRETAYPAIIPIPDRSGSLHLAEKKIIDNMEKAIGTNIFDK